MKSDESDQLGEEFKRIARNLRDNKALSVVFVLGFLDNNDFSLKKLTNLASRIFEAHFNKILWVLPVMHLDFNNIQPLPESSQVLAFRQSNLDTLNCKNNKQHCSLRMVLEKTTHYLNNCWRKYFRVENSTECSQEAAAILEYSVEPVKKQPMFR